MTEILAECGFAITAVVVAARCVANFAMAVLTDVQPVTWTWNAKDDTLVRTVSGVLKTKDDTENTSRFGPFGETKPLNWFTKPNNAKPITVTARDATRLEEAPLVCAGDMS